MIMRPKFWLVFSSLTMVVSLATIMFLKPVWGIDFTGGSLLEVRGASLTTTTITEVMDVQQRAATVQPTTTPSWLIRTTPLDPATHQAIVDGLKQVSPDLEEIRFESIGPTIGAELRRKAVWAILLSIVVMTAYLSYEFRHTGGLVSPWKYGVAATVALVHDLVFVTAIFVILGHTHRVSIDTLFVTAMLSVFGYSANDTIVLFNRIKQEWLASRRGSLLEIMDFSVQATLMRSLNTALTILLTLLTLLIFGGPTIHWFIVALIIGTIVGAYSTIFVAPPFLYVLARK